MMIWWCLFILVTIFLDMSCAQKSADRKDVLSTWQGSWRTLPDFSDAWSLTKRIPMVPESDENEEEVGENIQLTDPRRRGGKGKFKVKKRLKKLLLPLLLAYKLKFFSLIPVLVGGLLLLTGATGLAGFFFALFAASMGLRGGNGW